MKKIVPENVSSFFHKHHRTLLVSLVGFLLLTALTAGPVFVSAMITISAQRAQAIQQKNNAIEAAVLNNDYNTWSSLVTDENLKTKITAQNFSQFTEAYRLLQQGKVEEANLIKKQLALKQSFQAVAAKSEAIEEAIRSNNYAAWRAVVGAQEPQVNAGNFATYADAYKLIEEGKLRQGSFLRRDLGLKPDVYSSSR